MGCTNVASDNIIQVTFTQELSDVPIMTSTIGEDGDPTLTANGLTGEVNIQQDGATMTSISTGQVYYSAMGTMENEECSNRGICQRDSGICMCNTGYGSSNGNNEAGTRGDCGWKMPYESQSV